MHLRLALGQSLSSPSWSSVPVQLLFPLWVLAVLLLGHLQPAGGWLVPDPGAALMGLTLASSPRGQLVWRAWTVGMLWDLCDPGATCRHTLGALAGTAVMWPLRDWFYHCSPGSWALWAAGVVVAGGLARPILLGGAPPQMSHLLAETCATCLLTVLLGWWCRLLPETWSPLGHLPA